MGLFQISKVLGKTVYQLELPYQWRIHNVFHAALLMPYHETDEHRQNFIKPPPDLIDGQEEYEVEAIIAHRQKGHQMEYLIKWKGYASSDQTWEPETNVSNVEEILEEYKRMHEINDKTSIHSDHPLSSPSSRKPLRHSNR